MRFAMMAVMVALLLAGCTIGTDRDLDAPEDLGEFRLGHNVAVTPKTRRGPFSRDIDDAALQSAITSAVDYRFGRYEGAGLYHFGISVESFVLAQPGVPLVLSPKSALLILVTVWDDAAGVKLNEEPKQITVLESVSGSNLLGSGYTKTAEEQLEDLAFNAVRQIEIWLAEQAANEGWFAAGPLPSTE